MALTALKDLLDLPRKTYVLTFFVMFGSYFCSPAIAQTSRPFCQNPAFDKEVQRSLRFSIPTLDVATLHSHPEVYQILDAREWEEFQVSHIPGALWIGSNHFDPENLPDMRVNAPILVYCSIGYRSEKVAEQLKALGYTNIVNLYGSIFEWANRGYPLEDRFGAPTQALHTYSRKWSKWVDRPSIRKTW